MTSKSFAATIGRSAALLLAAVLSGCAVGPDFRPPPASQQQRFTAGPLPESTAAAPVAAGAAQRFGGGALPAKWWTLYRSPQLDELIRKGLADNPTLAAAQATLRQAQENLRAGYGVLFPSANLNASADRKSVV